MKLTRLQIFGLSLTRAAGAALVVSTLAVPTLNRKTPNSRRLAEVKESTARNKQELAHYSWTEQDIISLKGEEKSNAISANIAGQKGIKRALVLSGELPFFNLGHDVFTGVRR